MRNVTTNKEEYHLQINQCSSVSPIPNDSYTIVCIQNILQRNLSCRNVHYYIETMRNTIIPFPRNKFLTHSSNSSLYKQPNARLFWFSWSCSLPRHWGRGYCILLISLIWLVGPYDDCRCRSILLQWNEINSGVVIGVDTGVTIGVSAAGVTTIISIIIFFTNLKLKHLNLILRPITSIPGQRGGTNFPPLAWFTTFGYQLFPFCPRRMYHR